jgi:hypothetical protein
MQSLFENTIVNEEYSSVSSEIFYGLARLKDSKLYSHLVHSEKVIKILETKAKPEDELEVNSLNMSLFSR